jgi:hypothetical protein
MRDVRSTIIYRRSTHGSKRKNAYAQMGVYLRAQASHMLDFLRLSFEKAVVPERYSG